MPLHHFLASFVREAAHVSAFLHLVGRPYPGFLGREGSYPVDLTIAPPAGQRRLGVLARIVVALPALLLASVFAIVALVAAILGLVSRRSQRPACREGLRDLGAAALRYEAQTAGYLLLLTARYPDASPRLEPPTEDGRMTSARARGVAIAGALVASRGSRPRGCSQARPFRTTLRCRRSTSTRSSVRTLVARAERYRRFLYVDWVLAEAALLVTLAVYAKRGARLARESAAGPIGTGMLLGMVGLGLAWVVRLPFSVAALWWQRRHGLSSRGYVDVLVNGWLGLAGTFVALSLALLVLMALARRLGSWWWLPGSLVLASVAAALVLVQPYLTAGLEPVGSPRVERAYERFRSAQGVGDVPLRVQHVSGDTSLANAYAFGIGPSRRVVLWDTLLDGRFTRRQVDVVLAHELGHHSSDHIPKAIGWFTLFALPGAFLLMLATRGRGGMGEPAAIPLALLVVAVLQLAAAPAQNLVSRRMEAEADWKALQTTHDPTAARGLFRELAATSLGDPSPPWWTQPLFGTHPTLADRVAMADAWAARRR